MNDAECADVSLGRLPDVLAAAGQTGPGWMSQAESERCAAMRSQARRDSFVAAHWSIRWLAARVYGGDPREWTLAAAPGGAPRLLPPPGIAPGVRASLSHCAGWVAVAVGRFPVGIDIECNTKPRPLMALADATFSPEERELLRNMPDGDLAAAFYLRWTLKEATAKRDGHGLRREIARCQQGLAHPREEADASSWQFGECSLALAGVPGMRVRIAGVPESAVRGYWRIETAAV